MRMFTPACFRSVNSMPALAIAVSYDPVVVC